MTIGCVRYARCRRFRKAAIATPAPSRANVPASGVPTMKAPAPVLQVRRGDEDTRVATGIYIVGGATGHCEISSLNLKAFQLRRGCIDGAADDVIVVHRNLEGSASDGRQTPDYDASAATAIVENLIHFFVRP